MSQINSILLDREAGNGKYADVIDVATRLGNGSYGSATNALAVMVRQSRLFKEAMAEIRTENLGQEAAHD